MLLPKHLSLLPYRIMEGNNYFIHESAIVDPGAIVGNNTKIWHFSHLMASCEVGADCSIGQNVFIAAGVKIGNRVKIQNNVSIYTGVICEDDVFLGPSMVFTNVINPRSAVERKNEYKTTLVKKGATIGANATIVCGVEIGEYAFIGAGAVVTKNIKNYALVMGNPAKQSGWMSAHGSKLMFDENGKATCKTSGDSYQIINNNVSRI
jgi:UDP-2-acetamido-3-amino-2,3-dideoxy-glucuronate N-acetyltransferase